MLVHRTPEIVQNAGGPQINLIHVPDVARPRPAAQLPSKVPTKLQAPLADALVRDRDAPLDQDYLDITQAQSEHATEPQSVADDPGREVVTG